MAQILAQKRIGLVTGADRGIGFETAKQLAQKNVFVILTARRFEDAEAATELLNSEGIADVMALKLDVTLAEDRSLVAQVLSEHFGRLDILVNNAGLSTPEGNLTEPVVSAVSERELREVFGINLFAVVLLTQALLPLLKTSEAGRIVNVSSQLGSLTLHATRAQRVAYNKRFAYNASKAALNMFTVLLAQELEQTKIKVNSVHPGWVKTRTGGGAAPLEPAEGAAMSLEAALIEEDGPTGTFFERGGSLPW
jgi:NAD(P)-dependent dehydrogenase (short-subunit alcohol dehydrogenase family)